MKTRDKILQKARLLFNVHGFGNVSLALLSSELGIAKGNIWYHFNDKRALLAGLNLQYTDYAYNRLQMQPDPSDILGSYIRFIQSVALEIREFRFMFRDQAEYGAHSDDFSEELPSIYTLNFQQFTAYFDLMTQQGLLRASASDLPSLVHNVIIVLRYNIEFEKELGVLKNSLEGSVTRSCLQHLTLLKPYLDEASYATLVKGFSKPSKEDLQWPAQTASH